MNVHSLPCLSLLRSPPPPRPIPMLGQLYNCEPPLGQVPHSHLRIGCRQTDTSPHLHEYSSARGGLASPLHGLTLSIPSRHQPCSHTQLIGLQ